MAFQKLMTLAELGDRDCVSTPLAGVLVALFRAGEELFAMEDRCSHARWPLTKGVYRDGVVECALHKAQFCVRTGAALRLPATRPVRVYPLKVENGDIYIDLEVAQEAEHGMARG
jgi:3-phenylpropionate/trans-cinnamate dioxygenase ferredoxin component